MENGLLDALQGALDIAGFVPALGDFCDRINACIYYQRGMYIDSIISMGSIVFSAIGDAVLKPLRWASDGVKNVAKKIIDKIPDFADKVVDFTIWLSEKVCSIPFVGKKIEKTVASITTSFTVYVKSVFAEAEEELIEHAGNRYVYEMASGAEKSVDDIIRDVEKGDIKLANNMQKGNYGEMKMDSYYKQLGYERISLDQVTGLDDATHHGIDGVYYNPNGNPPYIIGEAKYGSSKLGMTKDGKQMSLNWIDQRLEDAVGIETADKIRLAFMSNPNNVQAHLIRISPEGIINKSILK